MAVLSLEQEVTYVDGESGTLSRQECAHMLIDGKLHAELHRVIFVDAERRWPKKDLMRLRVGDDAARLEKTVGTFSGHFGEEPPIPFVSLAPPGFRPITVNQAVSENVRTTVTS